MYGTSHHQDVAKPEVESRFGGLRHAVGGRRRRRSVAEAGGGVDGATFATAAGAAILLAGR
ncbi:hypothetical protein [Nocardioides sp. CER19]|uniref:hypothetical protein n=1 Tax=Nocardioides sp. CER19 TaxID=3038538 RepID=UPI0024478020|nr:hypothetical protein [Nocardioides sp. CER19]MDH2416194.1 hypothetical protein [Nocardioides sp. CER19]